MGQNDSVQSTPPLKVAYHLSPPFLVNKDNTMDGPSAWLWQEVESKLKLNFADAKAYNFEDLLTQLDNNSIDICISPLSITSERMTRFDFSLPYYTTHSSLLKRSSSGLEKGWRFLQSFFSLSFFQALGALALVILIFGLAVWYFERKGNQEEFGGGIKGLWSGFWWSAVTMTTVGYGDKSPKTTGGRVIALLWMFTAIIIISGFTASITSSLTVDQMGKDINSSKDFKNIKVATISNSGTAVWFKDNFITNVKNYNSLSEAVSALENEEIDYLAYDLPILQDILNHDDDGKYEMVDFKFNSQFYAMAFNKNLAPDIKKKISLEISKATESLRWKLLLNESNLIKE